MLLICIMILMQCGCSAEDLAVLHEVYAENPTKSNINLQMLSFKSKKAEIACLTLSKEIRIKSGMPKGEEFISRQLYKYRLNNDSIIVNCDNKNELVLVSTASRSHLHFYQEYFALELNTIANNH